MYSDIPINDLKEDKFGRENFVKNLVNTLIFKKDESSIVVGLEGEWGVGKTSILNAMESLIKEETKDAVIIKFNPWMIKSLDKIVETFLFELAAQLNISLKDNLVPFQKLSELTIALGNLTAYLNYVPHIAPVSIPLEKGMKLVGKIFSKLEKKNELSLDRIKEKINVELKKLNKLIIIIVDDIDRLSPEEIRTVIQLVKAICNFSRVTYLLAYDPVPIEKALTYGNTYDGKSYLEKIIQFKFKVPQVDFTRWKKFIYQGLENFLIEENILLGKEEENLLEGAFNDTFVSLILKTPRDYYRLLNNLSLSMKLTRDTEGFEINFADLFLFEVLKLKFPEILKNIWQRWQDLLEDISILDVTPADIRWNSKDTYERVRDNKFPMSEKRKELNNQLISSIEDENQKKYVLSVLEFLFPKKLRSTRSSNNYCDIYDNKTHSRIFYKDAFFLVNTYDREFIFSKKMAKQFLSDTSIRLEILESCKQNETLLQWTYYLTGFMEKLIVEPFDLYQKLLPYILEGDDLNKESFFPFLDKLFYLHPEMLNQVIMDDSNLEFVNRILFRLEYMIEEGKISFDKKFLVNIKDKFFDRVLILLWKNPGNIGVQEGLISLLYEYVKYFSGKISRKSAQNFILIIYKNELFKQHFLKNLNSYICVHEFLHVCKMISNQELIEKLLEEDLISNELKKILEKHKSEFAP